MPERLVHWWEQIMVFALVGIVIGLGQLLASGEKLTARIVLGRSLSTGGLAMAASAIVILIPDLSMAGQLGLSAALASLGTSGLERMFQRILQGR